MEFATPGKDERDRLGRGYGSGARARAHGR